MHLFIMLPPLKRYGQMLPSSKAFLEAFYAKPDDKLVELFPGVPFSWIPSSQRAAYPHPSAERN